MPVWDAKVSGQCAPLTRDAGDAEDAAAGKDSAPEDEDGKVVAAADDAGGSEPGGADTGSAAPGEAGTDGSDASAAEDLAPKLVDLQVNAGVLSPAYSPDVTDYAIPVDITVQTVTVTVNVPEGVTATIGGKAVDPESGWTSGVLNLGDNPVALVLSQEGGPSRTYALTVTRGFQEAYVKASNTGAGDAFGTSVAMGGDVLVIGAPYEDSSAVGVNGSQSDDAPAQDSGAAYVFRRKDGAWQQTEYLKATNTEAGDQFGASVAIYGGAFNAGVHEEIIVVGAPGEDGGSAGVNGDQFSNAAQDSGAAYVYGLAAASPISSVERAL